jgi:predicted alpha/beta superfamily hydrolase
MSHPEPITPRNQEGKIPAPLYAAHGGILEAARFLQKRLSPLISPICNSQSGYRLTIVGHSLGGGSSAILAALLVLDGCVESSKFVKAFGFGTPSVANPQLAEFVEPFVTTIIHNHDIIPRLTPRAFLRLFNEFHDRGRK